MVQHTPLKGLCHEMNTFLKDFENQSAFSDWAPMVFKFLWCLAVANIKFKVLANFYETSTNFENSYWNHLAKACSGGFQTAAFCSNNCSKSRLWLRKMFRTPPMHAHFCGFFRHPLYKRKSTNGRERKPEQKYCTDAAFGPHSFGTLTKEFCESYEQLRTVLLSYHIPSPPPSPRNPTH